MLHPTGGSSLSTYPPSTNKRTEGGRQHCLLWSLVPSVASLRWSRARASSSTKPSVPARSPEVIVTLHVGVNTGGVPFAKPLPVGGGGGVGNNTSWMATLSPRRMVTFGLPSFAVPSRSAVHVAVRSSEGKGMNFEGADWASPALI